MNTDKHRFGNIGSSAHITGSSALRWNQYSPTTYPEHSVVLSLRQDLRILPALLRVLRFICILSLLSTATAKERASHQTQHNTTFTSASTAITVNNWTYWIRNNGNTGVTPEANSGGVYPKGTSGVIYEDGFIWGGFMRGAQDPELRVGGQTYRSGNQPGWIQDDGTAISPDDPRARIYRIRPDYKTLSDVELAKEAAVLFHEGDLAYVTTADIASVRAQYAADWDEWPGEFGAPFTDVNDNNVWDNGIDIPGIPGSAQTIWLVTNDLDSALAVDAFGSPPMHIEQQITLWAYDYGGNEGFPGQVIYRRNRLVNKSEFQIDSMYVGYWSDPDVGSHTNDFVGCDTILDLAFAYNDSPYDGGFDRLGLPPPSFGYAIIQGPITPAPAEAALFDFELLAGYRNLPMTSFNFFAAGGWGWYSFGYEKTLQNYNQLRGYTPTNDIENPTPYIAGSGIHAGQPTIFPLSGDPVNDPYGKIGDVDGAGDNLGSSDRRMQFNSGPFNLAAGQFQEVIYAIVGGIDEEGNHLTSITRMKEHVVTIRDHFPNPIPAVKLDTVLYHLVDSTTLALSVDFRELTEIENVNLTLSTINGTDSDFALELNDSGEGADQISGDNIWSGEIRERNRQFPLTGRLNFDQSGQDISLAGPLHGLRTRPTPEVHNWQVIWENGQQDGELNFGETVGLKATIVNRDYSNPISNIEFRNTSPLHAPQISWISQSISAAGEITSDSLLITQTAPAEGDMKFEYIVQFDDHLFLDSASLSPTYWAPITAWKDTLPVVPHKRAITYNVIPTIADPLQLTGHEYMISFDEQDSVLVWNLEDITAGTILLENGKINDDPNWPHPVFDGIVFAIINRSSEPDFYGFSVVANGAGPLDTHSNASAHWQLFPNGGELEMLDNQQVAGAQWFIHTADNGTRGSYESFVDRTTRGGANWSQIVPYAYEMRFTAEGSWAWDPFNTGGYIEVPFELWNIGINSVDDPSDDFRMVPFLVDDDASGSFNMPIWGVRSFGSDEHTVSGADNDPYTDWVYWNNPTTDSDMEPPGEEGYQLAADSMAMGLYTAHHAKEVMARMVLVNWNGDVGDPLGQGVYNQELPEEGTIFRIETLTPSFPGDTLFIQAPAADSSGYVPLSFSLSQNYPNPFNATTTVELDLSFFADIKLEVFDLLGRRVSTLVDGTLNAKRYHITWDGYSDANLTASSGVYFMRLIAEPVGGGNRIVQSRKMVLLK